MTGKRKEQEFLTALHAMDRSVDVLYSIAREVGESAAMRLFRQYEKDRAVVLGMWFEASVHHIVDANKMVDADHIVDANKMTERKK